PQGGRATTGVAPTLFENELYHIIGNHHQDGIVLFWLHSFDLICVFDVLEHIQDEKKALMKIASLLKPAGTLIITVSAYSWLYGAHDKMLHHFWRYSKNTLNETINYSDLKVSKSSYFNTLLFPLVILARLTDMLKNSDESIGYSTPNNIVNHLFYRV
ncbi:MAG: class I SAM-dependent methyltransferase, partial [Desulfobacteraceae bacterium]|nr:class I SAM-dependent methyltransferase [Desulfobacteraceae bacterium]MBC2720681.1 methyltransferase domain-containing protein [Desulfobacteraceae bacterium]